MPMHDFRPTHPGLRPDPTPLRMDCIPCTSPLGPAGRTRAARRSHRADTTRGNKGQERHRAVGRREALRNPEKQREHPPTQPRCAAELAERTGEGTAYWLGFGPQSVGQWHMAAAREARDHERVVSIAEGLRPDGHAHRLRQAMYWVNYGLALSKVRGRSEDAVRAFRRAEVISPHHVHRDSFVPEALGGLLTRTRRDFPAGRELRRMAYRAGLPM
jgi:hypothetical protein